MTQLELYKEALRILKDSKLWQSPSLRTKDFNHGAFYFSGLCELLDRINFDNGRDVDSSAMRFKAQSENVLGRELDEYTYWFTDIKTDENLAKSERVEHLENLIKLYEKN